MVESWELISLVHRTVRWRTRQSGGAPDSPVNYSGAAPVEPEAEELESLVHRTLSGGAPDTVRWCTGQSGAPDQGTLRLTLALYI